MNRPLTFKDSNAWLFGLCACGHPYERYHDIDIVNGDTVHSIGVRCPNTPPNHDLGTLKPRIQNVLLRCGIHTLEQVASYTDAQLLSIPGLGSKALAEVKRSVR